jgi:hypothetical protein
MKRYQWWKLARPRISEISFWCACLLVAFLVFQLFLALSDVNSYYPARFDSLMDGTAHRPFVFRQLVPQLARVIGLITPTSLDRILNDWAKETPFIGHMLMDFRARQGFVSESLAALLVMYACLVTYGLGIRYLWDGIYSNPAWLRFVVPIAGFLLLPLFFSHGYVYDFATLACFAWGLGLMARGRWWPYCIVFFVSCWNRETTILLAMVFVAAYVGRLARPKFFALLAYQIGVACAVKVVLECVFGSNPGSTFQWHAFAIFREPLPISPGWIAIWLLFIVSLAWRLRAKPHFLRRAATLFIPLLAIYLLAGRPHELRIFYEFLPVATLLLVSSAASSLRIPISRQSPPLS